MSTTDSALDRFFDIRARGSSVPLTWSISHGIGYGFVAYVVIQVAALRFRDVHPAMYAASAACVAYFVLEGLGWEWK